MALVEGLPAVTEVQHERDHLVAVVSTREDGREVRSASVELGIPEAALRIRVLRYWLDPHPNDPERAEQLLKEQVIKWEKEDEDL